jgi:hypothetical protein
VHCVSGRLIELPKLGQDFGAEFEVMMPDQGNPPTKIFVNRTQRHQISLLKVCVVTKVVAIRDEALDCGCPYLNPTVCALITATPIVRLKTCAAQKSGNSK